MRPIHLAVFLSSVAAVTGASLGNVQPTSAPGTTNKHTGAFVTDIFSHTGGFREQIDLNGQWAFRRDPDGKSKQQGWHEGKTDFPRKITIPGVPQAQGIGEPTARQKTFFMEPFWVRRTFPLPAFGPAQRVWLRIGGILPAAEIYLNGSYVGYTQSSRTQQRVDVTPFAKPAAENLLAIKVCDFPEVRLDGIYELAECAKTWTGVYRPVACEITDRVSVIDAYVQPKLASGSVHVHLVLSEASAESIRIVLEVKDGQRTIGQTTIRLSPGKTQADVEVKPAAFTPWSPDHPKLYTLDIALRKEPSAEPVDEVAIRFGMREIETRGTRFSLNGKPIFLRCFGDDQYYPETLSPPADTNWFLSRLKRARQYGMNAVKGCVETIPQDGIEAADEAGILIIQEMPFGLSGLRANRYAIDQRFREYYAKELDGLIRVSRNHASVIAYSMSSELEFRRQTQESFNFFSRDLVRQTRKLAPHALAIDCTGYVTSENTEKGKRETDFYASVMPTWIKRVLEETPTETDRLHPTILHEYNWWSCYPDPADKTKYANMQLKPFWLDTLVKTAKENGQETLIPTYRQNSLWLQALCRKDGVEYARRNPEVEGYILWLLIDFGQYSEGLLDDFWNPKNVSAREFLESNGDTIIVLTKEGNRCLKTVGTKRIPLAVSHYGSEVLRDCTLRWETRRGSIFAEGALRMPDIKPGELTQAGCAALDLPSAENAYKFELHVALDRDGKTVNTNHWSFWAFPDVREEWVALAAKRPAGKSAADGTFFRLQSAQAESIPRNAAAVVADYVDEALADYIERGGKCLLLVRGTVIENTAGGGYGNFRTIPWNRGTTGNSGTVIAAHPALDAFPHDQMCDLQFLSTVRDIVPMEFNPLRNHGVKPIIRAIDHYIANRSNAYMLEFRVGSGNVLATSLNILPKLTTHIEAQYLLECLAAYVRGSHFQPPAKVPKTQFLNLFRARAPRK